MKTRHGMLLAATVVLGLLMWRSGRDANVYEDRAVALDSQEAKAALAMLQKMVESTNHIESCLSAKANPMVRQKVLQSAVQLARADKVELKEASWRQAYLSVAVACPTPADPEATLHFYLTDNDKGELKLIGAP